MLELDPLRVLRCENGTAYTIKIGKNSEQMHSRSQVLVLVEMRMERVVILNIQFYVEMLATN